MSEAGEAVSLILEYHYSMPDFIRFYFTVFVSGLAGAFTAIGMKSLLPEYKWLALVVAVAVAIVVIPLAYRLVGRR